MTNVLSVIKESENAISFEVEVLKRPDELVREETFREISKRYSHKIEYTPPGKSMVATTHL